MVGVFLTMANGVLTRWTFSEWIFVQCLLLRSTVSESHFLDQIEDLATQPNVFATLLVITRTYTFGQY